MTSRFGPVGARTPALPADALALLARCEARRLAVAPLSEDRPEHVALMLSPTLEVTVLLTEPRAVRLAMIVVEEERG